MATSRNSAKTAQQLAASAKVAANNEYERYMAEAIEKLAETVADIGFKLHHLN
ncbi:hypothetical protein [Mycobacteroides abscessus]|uniref:hypothetical protein n=1 Tax=Mycobacteroides abscessus TaxID=36809 RepID=UPI00092762DC|nr:hypothetical protein [Mycobacteroides abscessus]SIE90070.1 Uncharacterised protein [Mycobacteroides abscessus subsp. abscessus]SLE68214.1 Uncharacterised protein [Mycobacteroides abscessus subsp. massiliense]